MVDIFDSPSFSSSNPFGDLIKNDNNEESYFHSDDSIFENQSFDYDNNKIQKPLFPIKIPLNEQITRSSEKNVLNNLNLTPYKNQEEIKNVKEIAKDNNENIIDDKNDERNFENNLFLTKKRKSIENNNIMPKKNKRRGRKKMNNERDDIAVHTKHSKDNMITKIKTFIINAIIVLLNNSFIHLNFSNALSKDSKFLKISPYIYISKKKDANLQMLKYTAKDLLYNDICTKFKDNSVKKDHNKKLIDYIISQQNETDVIKILNLTFGEFLDFFRETISNELKIKLSLITNVKTKFMNIDSFLDKVREQEKRAGETDKDIDLYIENLRNICLEYEKWFEKKSSRENKNK